jgi:hypothetical protein
MLTNVFRCVLKDHLEFLATQDHTFGCGALEEGLQGFLMLIREDLFPFEFVALRGRVNSHKPLSVLDVGAKGVEFYDLILAVNGYHVFLLALLVGRGGQLKVTDGSLGHTIHLYNQGFAVRGQILNVR